MNLNELSSESPGVLKVGTQRKCRVYDFKGLWNCIL